MLGQVTAGRRIWADGTSVAGQDFTYGFDEIGNRTSAGGRASAVSANIQVNRLNQITSQAVAGTVDVVGLANPTADVTVQLDPGAPQKANRHGEYFHLPLVIANSGAPQYPQVTVKSLYVGTQTVGPGRVFVSRASELPVYDLDGNLTADGKTMFGTDRRVEDGRWTSYVWDAENRLVEMKRDAADLPEARQKLTFENDYLSRRIRKSFSKWIGGAWVPQTDTIYLYDGWNLITELDALSNKATLRTYTWGTDLSGTMTGAGGVGGLLWGNNLPGTTIGHQFAAYDGNGNVAGLIKATDSSNTAQYEYGPFGESIRTSGALGALNPIRWSSKRMDNETGLVYYSFRYYDSGKGLWLSRDPVGEKGGKRLHGFVRNDAINRHDYLGLVGSCIVPTRTGWANGWTGETGTYQGNTGPSRFDQLNPTSVFASARPNGELNQTQWFGMNYAGWQKEMNGRIHKRMENLLDGVSESGSRPTSFDLSDLNTEITPTMSGEGPTTVGGKTFSSIPRSSETGNNEEEYGDSPQNSIWVDQVLGRFWFEVHDLRINWSSMRGSSCCTWTANLVVTDGMGLNDPDDGLRQLLENQRSDYWFPSRREVRARWLLSGGCCCICP